MFCIFVPRNKSYIINNRAQARHAINKQLKIASKKRELTFETLRQMLDVFTSSFESLLWNPVISLIDRCPNRSSATKGPLTFHCDTQFTDFYINISHYHRGKAWLTGSSKQTLLLWMTLGGMKSKQQRRKVPTYPHCWASVSQVQHCTNNTRVTGSSTKEHPLRK